MGRNAVVIGAVLASLTLPGCQSIGQGVGPTPSPTQSTIASQQSPRPTVRTTIQAKERGRTGSDGWRTDRPSENGEIEGFTTHASAPAGTRVGLKVSTTASTYRVMAYRIGAYRGGIGRLVWRSDDLPGRRQPGPEFAVHGTRTVVAPWRRSLTLDTTDWPAGFYVLRLRAASGWDTQIPYIVSSGTARDTVALVTPVTTWQAYNEWGGHSLYAGPTGDRRAWAVSFDRPYYRVGGMNSFRTAVMPIVVRAEASGVPLSYFSNLDLHADPKALHGARGYVSMGHDEYWTPSMRQRVLDARDAGTNLAFLGANTMYWRVRLDARATGPMRLMTGYRDDAHVDPARHADPASTTARWRDAPAARPENDLVGMLYECYPVDAPYRIVTPEWWGFRGTGVQRGSEIPGLVGGESDRVYPDRRTPRPLQVLSHVEISCRGDLTSAQAVYYTTRSGAGVFTAGTLRWGCALVDSCDRPLGARTRDFARTVTANLLARFAQGPVAPEHPARDNLERFDLPMVNTVTAS